MGHAVSQTGSDTPTTADARSLRQRLLVPTLVLAGSLMAVVSSLGAPLIPTIARTDGVSLSTAEWLLTITLMTGALATPVMGRLADGPRQRDVIVFALGAVVTGCVLSAVSNGFAMMIVGRGLQGVGLGLLPVAMAIARRNLAADKARQTIATLSITTALGVGLGYPLTGLVAEVAGFRGAYWFGAITVTGALVLAATVLPPRTSGASRPFDGIGALTLSMLVIGVTVLLSEGGGWGWTSGRALGLLVASVVLVALWIPHELHVADPLIDVRQVRNRSVLTADSAGFLISIAMYLLIPVVVEFVQVPTANGYGFDASIVTSGLVLVPLSVGTFVASRFLAIYEQRFGARSMVPLGSVVFAVAATFFALEHSALWEAFVTMGIGGLGVGFSTGAMPGFIIRAVPPSETGSATGFYQVVRSIGLTVGSALERGGPDGPHPQRGRPARCGRFPSCLADRRRALRGDRRGQLHAARKKPSRQPGATRGARGATRDADRRGRGGRRRSHAGRGGASFPATGGSAMSVNQTVPPGGPGPKAPRSRDAAASKDALLRAAQALFGQNGFERTTIREIGERAGVDAALIARYFGNKADLYVAAVVAEDLDQQAPTDYESLEQMADTLVTRSDARGLGPILQAIIRGDTSPEIRQAALDRIARRLVDPLAVSLSDEDMNRPRLRAEIAVSALFGITLGRSLGWFDEIRSVPREELVALIAEALG